MGPCVRLGCLGRGEKKQLLAFCPSARLPQLGKGGIGTRLRGLALAGPCSRDTLRSSSSSF